MSATLFRGEGWHIRTARPDDNRALCGLLRAVPMEGATDLAQERAPDYFAYPAMHLGPSHTFVACCETTGALLGCGSYAVRDAWFPGGVRRPVGYVFDIRIHAAHRGARIFPELARAGMLHARDRHGVEVTYTALIDGNRRVRGAVAGRGAHRSRQPVSRPMTRYHMVSILFTGPKRAPVRRVLRGGGSDLDDLAEFIARRQAARTLGYVFDRDLLQARFDAWAGFAPGSFHLIRDARGRIVACAAPWEASSVRRLRVVRHRGRMRLYRALFNARARLRGGVPLPGCGEEVRYACLSHLEVEDDDPELLADLVRSVYADARGRGLHFLNVMVPRESALQRAFRGFLVNRMPMTLYSTTLPDSRLGGVDLTTSSPGFEMALA